ncbi:Mus7/MMS22 family-domain-containing protein [Pisolithus marmoratus]|nr:Mus7/MMS22 family-domain-containing protein [Pisolithus marmoratus]
MDVDEAVDTSDIDEREVLDISEANFWALSSPPKGLHEDTSGSYCIPRTRQDGTLRVFPLGVVDFDACSPSPRKRPKITHDSSMPETNFSGPLGVNLSHSPPSAFDDASHPTVTASQVASDSQTQSLSQTSGNMDCDQTPLFNPVDRFPSSPHFLRNTPLQVQTALTCRSFLSSSATQPPGSPRSSRSRSMSTEPWSLFSSPLCRSSTPLAASSQGLFGSPNPKSRSPAGPITVQLSPLTPISSSSRGLSRSPSPDELQLLPSAQGPITMQACSPRPDTLAEDSGPPIIPEDTEHRSVRYSLRRRDPRQLNPYAYDKLLYKQQMRSNPDAIVKFLSPTKKSHGHEEHYEDDTQAGCEIPPDNLDEDGDYVESIPNRQQQSASVGTQEAEGASNERDTGWLPEFLRPLSSSDEEDTDIRKLAENVRRERERAAAKAKAEAKRAELEARKAQLQARKAVARRKPFPIPPSPADVTPQSSQSVAPCDRHTPRPLRAQSEPMTSPVRPRRKPTTSSRASSHSPVLGSHASPSPTLNYDYQQDDHFQHFNDFEEPFERDPLPGLGPAFGSPSGPSIGETDHPLPAPSNELSSDVESGSSSILELTAKDRKRLRALRRMMPAAMIARHLSETKQPSATSRRARARSLTSSDSEAKEVPLIPGLARVRRSTAYHDVDIRGDPESSDVARSDKETPDNDGHDRRRDNFLDIHSTVRATPQPGFIDDEVISLSDDSEFPSIESNSLGDGESEADEKWADGQFGNHERGPACEKSLIDWMLTRSRGSSVKNPRSRKSRSSKKSSTRGAPRIDIVTSGAKGHGERQSSLLSFLKPATPSSKKNGSRDWNEELVAAPAGGADLKKRKKTRHHSAAQGILYNFHRDGVRITSKHREPRLKRGPVGLVVEDDDNDFYQALDPGWKAEIERWNKPTSFHQPVTRPSNPQGSRQPLHALPSQANPAPFTFDRKSPSPLPIRRHIVPDMNIHPLRPGVKFSSSSYLGKGMLYQLISVITRELEPVPPQSCDSQTFVIGPTTSAGEFSAILGPLYDRLAEALRNPDPSDAEKVKDWELVFRVSCQLVSWLGTRAEDEEFEALETAIEEYSNGFLSCLSDVQPSLFSLAVHWFLLELTSRLAATVKYRRGLFPWDDMIKLSKRLAGHILDIDLEVARTSFRVVEVDIETVEVPHRAAELWICLIHLLDACDNTSGIMTHGSSRHSLWRLIMELYPESSRTGPEASERMWRTVFNLCALSQFSLHGLSTSVFRLPAAWELIAVALKKIVLTANPEKEGQLPPRALRKRDNYLTCIVSRCFLLWSQWHWCLDEAMPMFKTLQEIFRSRNFVNLRNERSTCMGFLEHGNLELLSKSDRHDSVFEIFLKMVVQAVYSLNASGADTRQKTSNIKKLLQIAVPVSPVPFSRTAPPTNHELSMLLNRFSAMAVAIHLDPTIPNVRFRISQARRCVNFKEADEASRVACIYGMMYFARIMRHHRLPLDEALGWLAELTNVLMDDYKEAESSQKGGLSNIAKRSAITLIQLLLGSVRKIVETESLEKETRNEYPDPALLDGPWITRVFNPGTNLVMLSQTGLEIRMLVQSFLNARTKALPPAQPPSASTDALNPESQEEYERLYLELDDAELLAALGEEPVTLAVNDLKAKEDALCKVLDKSITPAVYRLVCKHLGDSENGQVHENRMSVADEWIECWVGCANVLIQNGNKDWSLYMKLGQQSWEKIIDSSWRRRVGLRFNLSLLRLDPAAYSKYEDDFISVLLISSVSSILSIEHEYASVVFTLDGLQHLLLRGAPFGPVGHGRRFEIGEVEYREKRVQLLETILKNAAERVRAGVSVESEMYVGFLASMFSAMRDIHQTDTPREFQESYVDFCRSVYRLLLSHNELASHRRLSEAIDWGQTMLRRDIDS